MTIDSDDDDRSEDDFNPMGYISIDIEEDKVEEHSDEPILGGIDKKSPPALQTRQSKRRTILRAKESLRAERLPAVTWKPRPILGVRPKVGMALNARWRCEQLIRAHTANLGVQRGVNILQTTGKLCMKCRTNGCPATFVFD